MMVVTFALFAVASWMLLRKKTWSWWLVMVAFAFATYIFVSDVDWSQPLGLQFG